MEIINKLGIVVFLISLLMYVCTLCPAIFTGDSAELITAAYTLGVPHSPGYPLYCLLGRLFCFIPLGNIAFRVNLMSAVFASLTIFLLYHIISELITITNPGSSAVQKFIPALTAGLIFAFSATFWSQAVVAEVYTLWLFLICLCFFTLLKWVQRPQNDNLVYLFSFICGLSVTGHQISLFFFPAFLFLILAYRINICLRPRVILVSLCAFLLGISLYLYIPLRARSGAALNWNNIQDINGFMDYLLRKQYGDVRQNYNIHYVDHTIDWKHLLLLPKFITQEFGYVWLIACLGPVFLFRKARRLAITFLFALFLSGIKMWMIVGETEHSLYCGRVYMLGSLIVLVILMGLGFAYLTDKIIRISEGAPGKVSTAALICLLTFAITMQMAVPLYMNYPKNDQSRNYLAYDFGRNILMSLEKDAILFGHGDNSLFSLVYLKLVEKIRPDVVVYDDIGGDVFKNTTFVLTEMSPGEQNKIFDLLLKKSRRPVYVTFGHPVLEGLKCKKELAGLVYRLLKENEMPDTNCAKTNWEKYELRGVFDGQLNNKDYLMRELLTIYHITLGMHVLEKDRLAAFALYRSAAEIGKNAKLTQEVLAMAYSEVGMHSNAISAARRAVELEPQDDEVYFNLGVAYAKAGLLKEAIEAWNNTLARNPNFQKAKEYIKTAKEKTTEKKK